MKPPIVLSIAGSDSGGGAGIQADLRTFHAFGCFGTTAVTAVTAQNTLGVSAIHVVPPDMVTAQIAAVVEDLRPAALKSGMLATADGVASVAGAIARFGLANYVLDPVMVATSGARLLAVEAERSIAETLLPLATLVTPNLEEAAILTGFPVEGVPEMRRAAEALVERGAAAALLKGGHLASNEIVDILFDGKEWHEWRHPKLLSGSTHGTGCTLSAAIAAGLAHGRPLRRAVDEALAYLIRAIETAPRLGGGHGPVNHFAEVSGSGSNPSPDNRA